MEGKKGGLERFRMLKEPDRRVVDVDLRAAGDTVKLAIYWMRKKVVGMDGKKGGVGSIIMTASLAGYLADGGAPVYSAAKHGMLYFIYKSTLWGSYAFSDIYIYIYTCLWQAGDVYYIYTTY